MAARPYGRRPFSLRLFGRLDQRLKSRVCDRLRSFKPAKYQAVEFKVFPADMSNNVDLRGPDDERPHVKSPH